MGQNQTLAGVCPSDAFIAVDTFGVVAFLVSGLRSPSLPFRSVFLLQPERMVLLLLYYFFRCSDVFWALDEHRLVCLFWCNPAVLRCVLSRRLLLCHGSPEIDSFARCFSGTSAVLTLPLSSR